MSFIICSLVILAVVVGALDAGRTKCDYTYFKDAGVYLKFQEMPLTFDDAQQRCAMEGGVLASPINDNTKELMTYTMSSNNVKGAVFTGFSSKLYGRGIFSSVEGVHLSDVPHTWAPDEPNNLINNENCIIMSVDGKMADANCDKPFPHMCFIKEEKAMAFSECGPRNKDYTYYKSTGSCYKFHRTSRFYDDAAKTCQAEGGYLVILNGDKEVEVMKELYCKNPNVGNSAFAGFRLTNGLWMTPQGETIEEAGFPKWAPGEPNNDNNQECGNLSRSGLLDDIWCNKKYVFICEKEPQIPLCPKEIVNQIH